MPKIIDKSQIKIIEEILKEPGINLREIIRRTRLSPNYVSANVNSLVGKGIVREEQLKKERVYLRRFYYDFESKIAKHYFFIVEDEKKEIMISKYPFLKPIFNQIIEYFHDKKISFIILYGSYARLSAEKDSDLDILIVGNIKYKEKIKEIFVSLPIEVSIKIESLKDFQKRAGDMLHQQIIKDHIIIYDFDDFAEFMAKFGLPTIKFK